MTGDGGFEARLFVDTATSLPLMLTWQDYAPWVATSSTREHALGEPAVQRQTEAFTAQWDKAEAALRRVEYRVHYSNFTMADGLKLPHTITRTVDGKVKDTTTFRVIRINQPIDDSRFSISKSQ